MATKEEIAAAKELLATLKEIRDIEAVKGELSNRQQDLALEQLETHSSISDAIEATKDQLQKLNAGYKTGNVALQEELDLLKDSEAKIKAQTKSKEQQKALDEARLAVLKKEAEIFAANLGDQAKIVEKKEEERRLAEEAH